MFGRVPLLRADPALYRRTCQACTVCASGCPFGSVAAAVDAPSEPNPIIVCAGNYTGDLIIDRDLTIIGAGEGANPAANTILTGTGTATVVAMEGDATVTLQDLRITGGTAEFGGGVLNNIDTTMTLNRCTVSDNAASGGGGIATGGNLTLTASTVSDNTASSVGGGILTDGGTVTLINSIVTGNTANDGGGIASDVVLTLSGSTVTGNTAVEEGGGILTLDTVACTNGSTVGGNTAGTEGTENCFEEGNGSGCETCPA